MARRKPPATRRGAPCAKCGATGKRWVKHNKNKNGGHWGCRACIDTYQSAYRSKHENKLRRRDRYLLVTYGITVVEYEKMLKQQKGGCAICGKRCTSGKRLAVDHSHKTGKVRGLLCARCNRGLGLYEDDPARLRRAAQYLTK